MPMVLADVVPILTLSALNLGAQENRRLVSVVHERNPVNSAPL